MPEWATPATFALGFVTVLYIWRRTFASEACLPLPPGPPGLPWLGNITGIDKNAPWITYAEWARTYGDLVHSRLFGKDIIIINSEAIAKDLLENRSRNYSDRPALRTNELCGLGFNTALMSYGDRWRQHRRLFHQTFRLDAASRFVPCQHRKACQFIQRLLDAPNQLEEHVFEYTTSIIMNSIYDYDPASREDELVKIVSNVLHIVGPTLRPDVAVLVDAFPSLLYLPSWFPGMSFKKNLEIARGHSKQYLDLPFEHALRKMLGGSAAASMINDALQGIEDERISNDKLWLQTVKEASATAFLGASETSTSVLMLFFLMMMMNPAVQEKAQAQIDEVVGRTRLPTIEDRPELPFVDAIFRELLRYGPTTPLSLPHAAIDDDVYNGFRIPKGAIVLPNLWSMADDESRYPHPHEFMPERFLNDDGSLKPNDTTHIAFGFGRRICVGKHFADTSIWSLIANVLTVFKTSRPLDEHGAEIMVEPSFRSGLAIHPNPFKCRIVPRSSEMDTKRLEQMIAAGI